MPRRKIGADLKEALCKLYEAGDISADTIEKHGIMSRATFFRNLKMYKTGASLEQRHSTGRKTNADKLKENDKRELDALHPNHLSHLELVLLLDQDEKSTNTTATRSKVKAKAAVASSKRRDAVPSNDAAQTADDSASESDADVDEEAALATKQVLVKLTLAARMFLASSISDRESSTGSDSSADLRSLSKPEDSQYTHSNRGALFIVRRRGERSVGDQHQGIVAAVALRSLIWTPEIYQALGPSYASRSIDKICNLARLRVDPLWQRKGIGRWLVRVAELKAYKLGFAQLYTQADTKSLELLSFWKSVGFNEFARVNQISRLEKAVAVPRAASKGEASKRDLSSSPFGLKSTDGATESASKKQRLDSAQSADGGRADSELLANPNALEIDPAIPSDPSTVMVSTTHPTAPAYTSDNAVAVAMEPPPRRIAFYDTSSTSSRSFA
ncbi:hypothetical protein EX895_004998 [Sporisorium graminicola]|uniref:N-acetyltransferase domain-containing protein n=1 Tax=Sporisorium graminicola TaxID=280036 RepID=A0A4U7KPL2_9BASI|nr:hypothetical protein EX895_004998 [Sporisorium graminicola]TKY86173.1 hypothetical protein EX895_004998 [Sporisorium graminicola]